MSVRIPIGTNSNLHGLDCKKNKLPYVNFHPGNFSEYTRIYELISPTLDEPKVLFLSFTKDQWPHSGPMPPVHITLYAVFTKGSCSIPSVPSGSHFFAISLPPFLLSFFHFAVHVQVLLISATVRFLPFSPLDPVFLIYFLNLSILQASHSIFSVLSSEWLIIPQCLVLQPKSQDTFFHPKTKSIKNLMPFFISGPK